MTTANRTEATPGTTWNCPKVPGLRLRHLATKSVYYLYYRTRTGRQRNMKVADERVMTLTQARELARELLQRVAKGEDPAEAKAVADARPTMQMLRDWHLERHANVRNKGGWAEDVERLYRMWVLPHFGPDKAVAEITEFDVSDLHYKMRDQPYRANRCRSMLSKAFNLAEDWGWRPRNSNPVQCAPYKEHKRTRQPEAAEAVRLLIALNAMRAEKPHFVAMVELLCFSGARLREIMHAKWEWVKPSGLHLPDSKTGEKIVPLSSLAREVLAGIPRVKGNPYIIVGQKLGRPLVNPTKPWKELMKAAGITVRLVRHDLRRFFASAGLSLAGLNLNQIGGLLGHMDEATTKRYAYLLTDAAQTQATAAADAVKSIMTGGGKVHQLHAAS